MELGVSDFIPWIASMCFDPGETQRPLRQIIIFLNFVNCSRPRPGAPQSLNGRLTVSMDIDPDPVFQALKKSTNSSPVSPVVNEIMSEMLDDSGAIDGAYVRLRYFVFSSNVETCYSRRKPNQRNLPLINKYLE
ncbi:hypothetical protein AVEN_273296-1 [Araneus ventricosus]|uniref:Uncharacterized protein n=1 Tax=Araneus ventricosus TaxID=182803 RepID=A0A4Y2MA28_ARAVE|nr:hypothetical protein AVEN_273296-1 [Araneus ventricosus]